MTPSQPVLAGRANAMSLWLRMRACISTIQRSVSHLRKFVLILCKMHSASNVSIHLGYWSELSDMPLIMHLQYLPERVPR